MTDAVQEIGVGKAYSNVTEWEAQNLTLTQPMLVKCYDNYPAGYLDDGGITIGGWGTTATNTLTLQAVDSDGNYLPFDRTRNIGFNIWSVTNTGGRLLILGSSYIKLDGIGFRGADVSTALYVVGGNGSSTPKLNTLENCTVVGNNALALDSQRGVFIRIVNSLIISSTNGGVAWQQDRRNIDTCEFINNTVVSHDAANPAFSLVNGSVGVNGFGILSNNVFVHLNGGAAWAFSTSETAVTATNNATSDASVIGTLTQVGVTASDFVSPLAIGNGDYRPVEGGKLDNTGGNYYAYVTTDLVNYPRPDTGAWEIGAFAIQGVQPSTFSIWGDDVTPSSFENGDITPIALGTVFTASTDGYITHVRFYEQAGNASQTLTGCLWNAVTQEQLASVVFSDSPSLPGWRQQALDTPVAITAGTYYLVSYHASVGTRYSADSAYFTTNDYTNGPLTAVKTSTATNETAAEGNGVFNYTSNTTSFPAGSFGDTNYWADIVFSTSVAPQPSGIYVAKGASFVQSVPHVAKGGSFVEPDSAWVVKSSAWVKVYEK